MSPQTLFQHRPGSDLRPEGGVEFFLSLHCRRRGHHLRDTHTLQPTSWHPAGFQAAPLLATSYIMRGCFPSSRRVAPPGAVVPSFPSRLPPWKSRSLSSCAPSRPSVRTHPRPTRAGPPAGTSLDAYAPPHELVYGGRPTFVIVTVVQGDAPWVLYARRGLSPGCRGGQDRSLQGGGRP